MIEFGVVESVEKMDRSRPGGRVAKTDLAGEFRMGRSHEGRHFFMTDLDVFHEVLCLLQRHVQTADAIAGIAVDALQSPF